ncbi:MAG: DUF1549 domain-containing protein, partial [Planctomycetota bacterium]
MKPIFSYLFAIGFLCVSTAHGLQEVTEFDSQQLEFFESKVRPILVDRCYDCHGPDASPVEGSFSMVSRKNIIAGGDTGPGMVPGHADQSLIIKAIRYDDVYEMPPDTKMPDKEIEILTRWVEMGAPWPSQTDVDVEIKTGFDLNARKKEHWCWQPIKRYPVPKIEQSDWPCDPIDHFVLRKLEKSGLVPNRNAEKRILIRRLYFDLIGLPPTPEEIQKFVEDDSSTAWETVIDELLDSPHFGERWARHWMDLIRYAESGGHEFDYAIPHAWRYRDYLIRAFNEDVSYKQMVHEHIAGDLIPNPRRHRTEEYNESVLGTGFWFLGEAKHAPVDSRLEEAMTIDNQIDVMSKTFLGLTVACARCHDHKFDAISAEDYYALSGFLQSSRRQEAMLDPGRKIEKAFEKIQRLKTEANRLTASMIAEIRGMDQDLLAEYLHASMVLLRKNPSWLRTSAAVFEAESLRKYEVTAGKVEVQRLRRQKNIAWQGDQHLWWRDGKQGDSWTLPFSVPTEVPRVYEIRAVFTKASDYGKAEITVNGKKADTEFDFYSPRLTNTGEVSLGVFELDQNNELKFVLNAPNERAAGNQMVGIDYLKLVP